MRTEYLSTLRRYMYAVLEKEYDEKKALTIETVQLIKPRVFFEE